MIKINRWELDQLSESEYNDLITKANYDHEADKNLDTPKLKHKEYNKVYVDDELARKN